ncbi:hypothetical protein KATP_21070 [Kluyvera ascorbata]|nr:hypothetical protein KATP_21070 [Kluyvera ascorbata]
MRPCWQPYTPTRRDNPVSLLRFDPYDTTQRVQQLRAIMTMPGFRRTVRVIMGKRNQWPRREVKLKARRHHFISEKEMKVA